MFKELIQNFIPIVQGILSGKSDQIPFRVVIAGRHLVMKEEYRKSNIPFVVVVPTLFDYSVVRDYVKKEMGIESNVDEIAAHLTHFTGGHPKCISSASKVYREPIDSRESKIRKLDTITREKIKEIYAGLPFSEDLRDFIIRLSLYRYLDYAMLADLREKAFFKDGSISALADRLTKTYLFDRQGRWIENKIARRVLALWLYHNYSKEDYKCLCKKAKDLCIEGLKRPREREPEIWIIEYLFQCLQSSTGSIQDIKLRKEISNDFWENDFTYIMQEYLGPNALEDQVKDAKKCLLNRIEVDWEFQFTINYYLREEKYTENPYIKLRSSIENF